MNHFKQILKTARLILFALMLAVCVIMGVPLAPPKRRQTFDIEMKAELADKQETNKETTTQFRADG